MQASQLLAIGGATALAGCYHSYREWKKNRRALPTAQRNAGFWTDRRLKVFDVSLHTIIVFNLLAVVSFAVWLVGGSWGWWCWPYCSIVGQ